MKKNINKFNALHFTYNAKNIKFYCKLNIHDRIMNGHQLSFFFKVNLKSGICRADTLLLTNLSK